MCGIVGLLSPNSWDFQKKKKYFTSALYANALRGMDSTGIFGIPHNPDKESAFLYKRAVQASDFLQMRPVEKIMTDIEKYWAVIGHNRAATFGKVNNQNAHPFHIGNITLVHNGSLSNYSQPLPNFKDYAVDSEAICASINKIGIEETAPLIHGAFALVWHDKRNNTINLLRNEERPLYFCTTKEAGDKPGPVLIGSEHLMMEWLASRPGSDFNIDKTYTTRPGDLVVFSKDDLSTYEIKKMKLYEKPVTTSYTTYSSANDGRYINGRWESGSRNSNVGTQTQSNLKATTPNTSVREGVGSEVMKIDLRTPTTLDATVLESVGLTLIGEEFEVDIDHWYPYDTNQNKLTGDSRGYLIGYLESTGPKSDLVEVRVNGVLHKEKVWFEGETITAIVAGVQQPATKDSTPVIHARNPAVVVKQTEVVEEGEKKTD